MRHRKVRPDSYKLSRFSVHDENYYLISVPQRRELAAHGAKYHYPKDRKRAGKLERWWYLLPGNYYLFFHSAHVDMFIVSRLAIFRRHDSIIEEEHIPKGVPDWLYDLLATFPEFDAAKFEDTYKVYIKQ